MAFFSSPAQAQADGSAAYDLVQRNYLHNMAMRKLTQMYGPVAGGDPAAGMATENYLQTQKMNPLAVQQAQLANAGNAENNNYLAQRHPYDVQQAQQTATGMGQTNQFNAANNPAVLDSNRAMAAQNQQAAATGQAGIDRNGLAAMVAAMQQGLGAGKDPATMFDQIAPIASRLTGAPLENIVAQKDAFVKDPMGYLAQVTAAINGGGDQGAPAASVAQGGPAAGAAVGTMAPDMLSKLTTQWTAADVIRQRVDQLAPADGSAGQIDAAITAVQTMMDRGWTNASVNAWAAGDPAKHNGWFAPGVAAQDVSVIEAQLGLADLQAMANTGLKLGKVTNLDMQVAMKAYQNLSMNQNPQDLIDNLKTVKTFVAKLRAVPESQMAAIADQLRAGGGTVPGEDASAAQTAAPAAQDSQRQPYYGDMTPFADAIKVVESSGNYSATGPTVKGDKAYGAYQVMGNNIPSWTKEALGVSMTSEQFLASPEAQDVVFNVKFRQYLNKYGTPEDAASAWFTGGPRSTGAGKSDGGSTTEQYISKFMAALPGGAPQGASPSPQGQPTGATAPPLQGQPVMMAQQALPASSTPAPQQMIQQAQAPTPQMAAPSQPAEAPLSLWKDSIMSPPQQPAQPAQQALLGAPGAALDWNAQVGNSQNSLLQVLGAAKAILAQHPELAEKMAQRMIQLGISPTLLQQGQ